MENEKDLEKEVEINEDLIEDEDLKKNLQTLVAQKKHYREKFLKESETSRAKDSKIKELEEALSKINKVETSPKEEEKTQESALAKELERVKLQVKGYSDDEIEFIEKVGGSGALENEYVKTAIEQMRAKNKSLEADPETSGGSPVYKKYTEEDMKRMSSDELEKILKKM